MVSPVTAAARAEDDPPLPDPELRGAADAAPSATFRPRPRKWWMLSGILLIGLIACASIAAILNSRERALTLAARELQNLAFVLAAQASATFETIDRVQANLAERIAAAGISSADEFEQRFSTLDAHLMLRDKHIGLPHVGAFALANAEGRIFNFSRGWPAPEMEDR